MSLNVILNITQIHIELFVLQKCYNVASLQFFKYNYTSVHLFVSPAGCMVRTKNTT